MIYILTIVAIGVIAFFIGEYFTNTEIGGMFGILGLFMGLAICCLISSITDSSKADYENFNEKYELKEIHENQYYTTATDGNSISVWIMDCNQWKKKTFSENVVKFQTTPGEAAVQIDLKRIVEPSKTDKMWFFKSIKGKKKEIIKSVVISVPEDSELVNQQDFNEPTEMQTDLITQEEPSSSNRNYCSACGIKLSEDANYCSGCGRKVK